jgi:hypothetical protein
MDKVINQTIRMALNVKSLQSQIQQMQLRWFGHVVRMPESRYPRMAWETRYEGRRTRGRHRTKWHDNIQNALLEREWTGDRPDHGHETERYGMLFAKPLHLTVEEARLSEVK